jgi:hypothetical protein
VLTVTQAGREVFRGEPSRSYDATMFDGHRIVASSSNSDRGGDVTGRKEPLLFIRQFLDAKEFVATTHVFSLVPTFTRLGSLEAVPNEGARFEDRDRDGLAEAIVWDTALVDAQGDPPPELVEAHLPEVVLRWQLNRFVMATNLMLKPKPDPATVNKLTVEAKVACQIAATGGRDPFAPVWPYVTSLAYAGHLDIARLLFFEAVPAPVAVKAARWKKVNECLSSRSWWRPVGTAK